MKNGMSFSLRAHITVRTESGRSIIIELSIPPLKVEEGSAVNKREDELNKEDYAYLNVLRKKFRDILFQLNVHDDDDNVEAADRNLVNPKTGPYDVTVTNCARNALFSTEKIDTST